MKTGWIELESKVSLKALYEACNGEWADSFVTKHYGKNKGDGGRIP